MPDSRQSIFLSYRRAESRSLAQLLADHLDRRLPGVEVFLDVESIAIGTDFSRELRRAVGACQVLLVLVGPHWATAVGADGRQRLADPGDYVGLELRTARERGIAVIPVVDAHASMPTVERLPPDLRWFGYLQAFQLHADISFDSEVARLADHLGHYLQAVRRPQPAPRPHQSAEAPTGAAVARSQAAARPRRTSWVGPTIFIVVLSLFLVTGASYAAWTYVVPAVRRLTAPTAGATVVDGSWKADKRLRDIAIEVVRVRRAGDTVTLEVVFTSHRSSDFALGFPFGSMRALDDQDRTYEPSGFDRAWQSTIPAGEDLRADITLDPSMSADATTLSVRFSYAANPSRPQNAQTVRIDRVPVPPR